MRGDYLFVKTLFIVILNRINGHTSYQQIDEIVNKLFCLSALK